MVFIENAAKKKGGESSTTVHFLGVQVGLMMFRCRALAFLVVYTVIDQMALGKANFFAFN